MSHDEPTPGLMDGKTVVITGGTSGIGKATVVGLAQLGAQVAITGRDTARVEVVAEEIGQEGIPVHTFVADLSNMTEVRRLADELLLRLPRIDVLINNVGGYWNTRHVTADGLEHTFALNHLAPFLLTNLLLERLQDGDSGRVVTVASNMQAIGRIDFDDLQSERGYSGGRAYNQSKLANVLFTYELARRTQGTNVTANALHPGVVNTSFGAEDPAHLQRLMAPVMRLFMKSPKDGAATSIHVASSPSIAGVNGRYFAKSKMKKSSKRSYDHDVARRLWEMSAAAAGIDTVE
jgi:NAD(P)-dependent dehydrogenase (short-subunit alcohol dehydrogenase family)